jgi:hypothetical protein
VHNVAQRLPSHAYSQRMHAAAESARCVQCKRLTISNHKSIIYTMSLTTQLAMRSRKLLTDRIVLTKQNHRNAKEAGNSSSNESQTSGQPSSKPNVVHHIQGNEVSGRFKGSADERVQVDVAVKCSRVQ